MFPYLQMNNGHHIPAIGLGTYAGTSMSSVVQKAIDIGYRMFDTAYIYQNETEIGEGIKKKIQDGTIKREDVFVVSKLWNTFHKPELVEPAIKKSLSDLKLDYIDLYLIHWPFACKKGENEYSLFGLEEDSVPIEDTWKAMEGLVKRGYTKSIGLSNFNIDQIQRVLNIAQIKPVVNQTEINPYNNEKKLIEFCKQKGIILMSYSPFWNANLEPIEKLPSLFEQKHILHLMKKYKKTAAQIVLRYLIQLGTVPIPKTDKEERLKINIDVFDFVLSEEDMSGIDQLNRNYRCSPCLTAKGYKEYPFARN